MATRPNTTHAPAVEWAARLIPTFLQIGLFSIFAALVALHGEG